jgi:crossover junction endodeoxyribonuclease RuvC
MFDSCVLGVDPGIASTGLAGVSRAGGRAAVVWSETVRTPSDLAEPQRLLLLFEAVRSAIASIRPESIAVERVMFGQNKTSALAVARATGVILLAAAEAGLEVEEYVPLEVKMAITGVGNADKKQVRESLIRAHRVEGVPQQPDAADAVAVALCHLHQSRLRAAARRVGAR